MSHNAQAQGMKAMQHKPLSIAVFASGAGTNFKAIAQAIHTGQLDATIELLVCDRPSAPVVALAEEYSIPVFTFRPKEYASREDYETIIVEKLQQLQVKWVVLAGYMRLVTPALLKPYEGRMLNIHPSLLPAFPGLDAIGQAIAYGVKVTGVTVHLVDGGLDSGPIIAQRVVEVLPSDTADELAKRIQQVEHALYPQVIQAISAGQLHISGRNIRLE